MNGIRRNVGWLVLAVQLVLAVLGWFLLTSYNDLRAKDRELVETKVDKAVLTAQLEGIRRQLESVQQTQATMTQDIRDMNAYLREHDGVRR